MDVITVTISCCTLSDTFTAFICSQCKISEDCDESQDVSVSVSVLPTVGTLRTLDGVNMRHAHGDQKQMMGRASVHMASGDVAANRGLVPSLLHVGAGAGAGSSGVPHRTGAGSSGVPHRTNAWSSEHGRDATAHIHIHGSGAQTCREEYMHPRRPHAHSNADDDDGDHHVLTHEPLSARGPGGCMRQEVAHTHAHARAPASHFQKRARIQAYLPGHASAYARTFQDATGPTSTSTSAWLRGAHKSSSISAGKHVALAQEFSRNSTEMLHIPGSKAHTYMQAYAHDAHKSFKEAPLPVRRNGKVDVARYADSREKNSQER
jgi:hypothetical protein